MQIKRNDVIELMDGKKYIVKEINDILNNKIDYLCLNLKKAKEVFYLKDLKIEQVESISSTKDGLTKITYKREKAKSFDDIYKNNDEVIKMMKMFGMV